MRTLSVSLGVIGALALALSGCSAGTPSGSASQPVQSEQKKEKTVKIKTSHDKHIQYVKNYVGMNAKQVGYTALDGLRHDHYGDGNVVIVFVTPDGQHLELGSDDNDWDDSALKDWKVSAQSVKPNSEINYVFNVDSETGEEEGFPVQQNIEEIVLALDKVGQSGNTTDMTSINPAADKYTYYVKDYVGRNLADCGYISLGGTFNDSYGPTYLQFDLTAEDGSYIDPTDKAALAGYRVVSQSVEPNTELKLTFGTDSDGTEYSSFCQSKSFESIALTVEKLD